MGKSNVKYRAMIVTCSPSEGIFPQNKNEFHLYVGTDEVELQGRFYFERSLNRPVLDGFTYGLIPVAELEKSWELLKHESAEEKRQVIDLPEEIAKRLYRQSSRFHNAVVQRNALIKRVPKEEKTMDRLVTELLETLLPKAEP